MVVDRVKLAILGVSLVLGCGPEPEQEQEQDTDTSASTGPASEPSSGTAVGTSTADDTGTGDPASVCDPQPVEGIAAEIRLDGGTAPVPAPPATPYVFTACTISSSSDAGQVFTFELDCADGGHTLEVTTSTGLYFDTAGELELAVIQTFSTLGGEDQLVTLRRADGQLVLAGGRSPVAPDGSAVPADFFAPLDVALVPDVCAVDAGPSDGCFTEERQALRFMLGGDSVEVYDRGSGALATFALVVAIAMRYGVDESECSDVPETWYEWVVVPPIPD